MPPFRITPRRQRSTILATALVDLDGNALVLDCLTPGCAGERWLLIRDLVGVYGREQTVAEVLRRFRCTGCGRRPVAAAWLTYGPGAVGKVRAARLPLIGPAAVRD